MYPIFIIIIVNEQRSIADQPSFLGDASHGDTNNRERTGSIYFARTIVDIEERARNTDSGHGKGSTGGNEKTVINFAQELDPYGHLSGEDLEMHVFNVPSA